MIQREMNRRPPDLSSALAVDARLTEIERELNLLLNVTPTNGAEAWTDFERSGFESVPTLQSRPLDFDPDLVKRDLYNVEIERVEDPALNSLFRAKRDEIARQITPARGSGHFALQVRRAPALRRTRGIAGRDGSLAARAHRSATDHVEQRHRDGIRRGGTNGARVISIELSGVPRSGRGARRRRRSDGVVWQAPHPCRPPPSARTASSH